MKFRCRWPRRALTSRFCVCCAWKLRPDLSRWLAMLETLEHPHGEVRIGVVGKYVQLEDAYKSLREALGHGGLANRHRVVIEWVEAEEVDSPATAERLLRNVDGILVPGGFGKRGISGMVHAITYARERKFLSSAFASGCSARRSIRPPSFKTWNAQTAPNSMLRPRIA